MSTSRASSRSARVCGPECRYARLYEGSQTSLSDMAARQTATLERVSTLRDGLVSTLKQHFPTRLVETERRRGHKLGGRGDSDAVVLAVLNQFLQDASAAATPRPDAPPTPTPGLDDLRAALLQAGFQVGTGTDLAAWASAVRAAAPERERSHATAIAAPAPIAQDPVFDETDPWFGHETPSPDSWGDLEDVFLPDPPSPAAPTGPGLDSLFDEGSSGAPVHASADMEPEALVDSLFGPARPDAGPTDAPTPPQAAPSQSPLATPDARPVTPKANAAGGARTAASVVKPEMFPPAQLPRASRAKRNAPRTPRVTAAPPVDRPELPTAVATERFDELTALIARPRPVFISDLVAASQSPGLVTAWESHYQDLGSASPFRVITPRAHHRARGSLVVPHSTDLRQALAGHGRSGWADCLDESADRTRLRGARLYEAAVLLHRFADDIVSHKLTSEVLALRLNTPQGLTGAVVWLGSDSPAGSGRSALTEAVAEMIEDRMVLLAVLTHESGARAVERLASVVADDAATHDWQPTMPVVASHSWEFAADGGATSLAVL